MLDGKFNFLGKEGLKQGWKDIEMYQMTAFNCYKPRLILSAAYCNQTSYPFTIFDYIK